MSSFVRVGSLGFVFFLAFVLVACGKKKDPLQPSLLCSKAYEHILRVVEKEAQSALLQAGSPKATRSQKKQAEALQEEQKRLRSKQGKQRALALCTTETKEPSKKKPNAAQPTDTSQKSDASNQAALPKKAASSKKESPEHRRKRARCALTARDLRMLRDCYQPNTDLSLYARPMPFETSDSSAMTNSKSPQPTLSPMRPTLTSRPTTRLLATHPSSIPPKLPTSFPRP